MSTTQTVYDSAGRVLKSRDANGLWTQNFYGFAGDVVQTRSQSIDSSGVISWVVSRTKLDSLGRPELTMDSILESEFAKSTTAPLGTRTFYDSMGRADKTERRFGVKLLLLDRNGAVVKDLEVAEGPFGIKVENQGVDSAGNINLISRSQSYYNQRDQLIRSVSGIGPGHEGTETRYEYDDRGRQIRQIGAPVLTVDAFEPLRMVTETEYDDKGRAFRTWTNIRGRDVNGKNGAKRICKHSVAA